MFVFFGLVATVGLLLRADARPSPGSRSVSGAAMGCLATALLVVNNLRDIPGDTAVGKRTLAVRLGDRRTRILYVVLLVLPVPAAARSWPAWAGRPLAALALRGRGPGPPPGHRRARAAPGARS